MGSAPFALSVHHFISSVGADAGFASIIGLAILILLYFAQARETASLRGNAHESAERIQDLEARLAQLARVQESAAAASRAPVAAPRAVAVANVAAGPIAVSRGTGQQPAFAAAPVAPAGVGAPSLAAATKLIPTPAPAPVAGAVALAPGQPGDRSSAGAPATVAGNAAVAGAAGVRAGSNGSSHPPASGTRPGSAPSTNQTPPPRIQIRPGSTIPPSRRGAPPSRGRAPQRSGSSRRRLFVLLGAVAVIIVVAVLLFVTGSVGGSTSNSTSTRTTNTVSRKRAPRRAAVSPANVAVSVLNGTPTTGLAHTVAQSLTSLGYKQASPPQTASDQTHTTTVVAYLPGFKQDALAVAKSLKLSSGAVAPVDQPAQALACPGPAACNANVIVTVGSDLVAGQ